MGSYQYKREPLTPEEASRLENACETPMERLVVWTLLDTGMRVSELASLRPSSIDWQNHRLVVYGKGGPYGSRSKRRVIPMSHRIRALLETHFAHSSDLGLSVRTIQRMVKRVANRAKISRPVCPHVLRHTFACRALQKGISLAAVQKLLGHDHLSTTQIYLNLTPDHVIEEFERKW